MIVKGEAVACGKVDAYTPSTTSLLIKQTVKELNSAGNQPDRLYIHTCGKLAIAFIFLIDNYGFILITLFDSRFMKFIDFVFQDFMLKPRGGVLSIIKVLLKNNSNNLLPLLRMCQFQHIPKILHRLAKRRYYHLCDRYSVYLPIETKIGKNCVFPHGFPLVINPEAIIGDNCIIHPCVLIGRDRGKIGAPIIGDNCFIGHGAKIIGNPHIGN